MARKVFVTSDMAHDERLIEVAQTSPEAALLWPWILTHFDDWGRAEANSLRIKAKLFPMNPLVTVDLVETALKLFDETGLITLYEHDGKRYMSIPPEKWYKYQTHIRREKRPGKDKLASDFPAPPGQSGAGGEDGIPQEPPQPPAGMRGELRGPVPPPPLSTLPPYKEEEDEEDAGAPGNGVDNRWSRATDDPEWSRLFAQIFRGNVNELVRDEIAAACDEFGTDMVKEAMRRALENADGPPRLYLRGIFQGWREQGVRSLADLQEVDERRKAHGARASPRRRQRESAALRLLREEGIMP